MVGFFVIFTISRTDRAQAAAGDIVIVVNDELGTSLTGATVSATVACTGGADFTAIDGGANDDDSAVNGVIVFAAANIGDGTTAECDNGEVFTKDLVAKDGYVTEDTSLTTYSTAAQNDATTTLDFSHKIIVKDELNTDLTPNSATAGGSSASCTVVLNNVYCPVVLADDDVVSIGFNVVKPGYVTANVNLASNRTAATDPQALVTMDATNGLDFSHKVVIKDELNTALTPDSVAAGASLVGCTISANSAYCPVLIADDTDTSKGFVIVKDGYVTSSASSVQLAGDRTTNSSQQMVTTMTATNGLDFSHKFIVVDELGTSLTVTSATAGSASVACTISGGSAYCPVLLAQDNTLTNGLVAVKDGYVTTTAADVPLASNRTAGTDAQGVTTMTTANGLDFSYIITGITSEVFATDLTATATSVRVGDDTGLSTCTFDTDTWYCPVVLANSDGTMVARVYQDGYVQKDTYALTTGTTRLLNTTAQKTDTIAGIQYAVKATATVNASGSVVSGATVTAGDSLAVSCTENGTTGIYYCAIPLADTEVVISVVKSGYNNGSNTFADRTTGTDTQVVVPVIMYLTSSGSGNTGQGSSGGSTGYATNPVIPAPVVENPATPTNAPETPKTDIVSIINQERDIVISQTNPENFFINTGTSTTSKLGSGERGAAISSYKEAYGIAPKSSANWVDVLNIANGRWPLTVNKAVEARAYTNFKLVYSRVADMKNSTDVNALKMMGYGVRSTKARDLSAERSAIVKFKATFGFGPSNARHWNIVRAIAYSGVIK